MDKIDKLFDDASLRLGYALGSGDTYAAATQLGMIAGITLAELPDDERPAFYGAMVNVNQSDIEEIGNAAAYVTRVFWALSDA